MRWKDWIWPVVGLAAVALSIWLLVDELRGISLSEVEAGFAAISWHQWLLSIVSAIVAYAALAGYDHIALLHIGKRVNWFFVTACSFCTYALSHNMGGSIISGAVIRYRAYGTKGLNAQDVGVLVAICWFTFVMATVLLCGVFLTIKPELIDRVRSDLSPMSGLALGVLLLLSVAAYVFGSWLHFRPVKIWSYQVHYPRLPIVARQLIIGPLEVLAAISILYFVLPAEGNPGFITISVVFIISFAIAQISHAPGGIGVLEVVFIKALPEMNEVQVLTALLVFRLFYLVIPLLLSIVGVILFERSQLATRWARTVEAPQD